MTSLFGVPLVFRDSLHMMTEQLTDVPDEVRVRLTGDSGTWSSSREKELLKALLNVSLFCLCLSIVPWMTCEEIQRKEEKRL